VVEAAVVVQLAFLRPERFHDVEPLGGGGIALVMLELPDSEHAEFGRVPAGNDVEPESAAADVVDRGAHFRGEHRMVDRHVAGGEHLNPGGHGGDRGGPTERVVLLCVRVVLSAVAPPASDRQQEVPPGTVGQLGD
jgi:hypothetical protein